MSRYEQLKAQYDAADQGHVFSFWDSISTAEQDALLDQLDAFDPPRVNDIYHAALKADDAAKHASPSEIEPLPSNVLESVIDAPERAAAHHRAGLQEIAAGRVAVLLMAGGQGTRLGSSDPKGCYDIGLPSHKPLFQLQAERIRRLQTVAEQAAGKPAGSVKIRWYIMTSDPTHDATRNFFGWDKDGKRIDAGKPVNFGLDADQVVFFKQGVLPCLSSSGKILLESPSKVAVAPNGNGGLYAALRTPLTQSNNNLTTPSILSDLSTRGITLVHAYCVDNCLVKVADPVFLGACATRQADCAAKTVPKEQPDEKVGVVARRAGRFAVVEYSEITPELASMRDPSNPAALALRAGNIANHVYTLSFLERTHEMERSLAHHIARKKIPSITSLSGANKGETGKTDGMKLEMFVFDVFPFAERFFVLEGARNEEFSPLKNAPGTPAGDSPETSRRDLLAQQRRFLEAAGAKFASPEVEIELSPLVTYSGEGLESVKGKTFKKSGHVETPADFDKLL
ncbi:UDP-N-acetylglucosamine pyrophosphorylase [Fomitiporia mediterranea MF3/22]|uniref:UDP-N-acetylglucosamine pyrophosphorylase n=1 Tax=Fomitiporia mediterranea (strain MF3/22) TaxID=694068 RepID=UPI0004409926|nr:UDP-N-acetylglucosamine pyrophosphorylase [Fomitiporia mediterranea MF3/22]EJC98656.1 UDP-N-acetylglucosamine pyrophosphorylase [Fomitiporia mediterranea MF3/22]